MKRVIALGFFDGVHLGHGALLKKAAAIAEDIGASPCVLTFDRHPEEEITGREYPLLGTMSDRDDICRRIYGIKEVIFTPFDEEMMHMPWEMFVEDILIKQLDTVHVVAGYDYQFGCKAKGNANLLKDYCEKHHIGCDIVQKVELEGIRVSSTYIRKLVAQGDMERAMKFLGHPYAISGQVSHGQGMGTSLGTPTINISIAHGLQRPALGVYVTNVCLDNRTFPAITNIGTRPTISVGDTVWVESNLFGFEQKAYGKTVRVDFLAFLRPERRFLSLKLLSEQIQKDIAKAKKLHEVAST